MYSLAIFMLLMLDLLATTEPSQIVELRYCITAAITDTKFILWIGDPHIVQGAGLKILPCNSKLDENEHEDFGSLRESIYNNNKKIEVQL